MTSRLRLTCFYLLPFNRSLRHATTSHQCLSCVISRCIHSLDSASQATLDQISTTDLFPSKDVVNTPSELFLSSKPPSVTKILKATESVQSARALERWKLKMIEQMGEEAFKKYSQGLLRRGTAIHTAIHRHMLGEEGDVDEETQPFFTSVSTELSNFHDVHVCEKYMSHNKLPYCGVVDCVAQYNSSGLYVIDWKTSSQKKTSASQTFDHPLQLAAYAGLWNSNERHNQVTQGMLVMMYSDSSPCNVIKVSEKALQMYWKQWKSRLHQYWQQKFDTEAVY